MSNLTNDEFSHLLKKLTAASPGQLKEIRAKSGGLLDLSGDADKAKPTKVVTDDWLFDGLVEELVSRGLLHRGGVASVMRSPAFKSYSAKAAPVRALLLAAAPGLPKGRIALQALGVSVAYCLAESLSQWAPLSISLMLAKVDKVPEAVDESFPGYMTCGLLGKLVKITNTVSG